MAPKRVKRATMTFEIELAYFEKNRSKWIEHHQGEFAVICGEELLNFYATMDKAFTAGLAKFGEGNYLAKEVTSEDKIEVIHRVFWGTDSAREAI